MGEKAKKHKVGKQLILLHIMLLFYSMGGIFGKTAAGLPWFSIPFLACYAAVICILGVYAIGWQQIIKGLPLTTAFANKAVTVVWGMVWGTLLFQEQITIGKMLGAALVVLGVVIFAQADGAEKDG